VLTRDKKSCYLRMGARRDKLCSSIHTLDGREFDWVDEVSYLGVHINLNSSQIQIF